jgi:hypothetical protein
MVKARAGISYPPDVIATPLMFPKLLINPLLINQHRELPQEMNEIPPESQIRACKPADPKLAKLQC